MTVKLAVSIGLFVLLLTASDAFANGWFKSGGSSGGSRVAFGSTSNNGNTHNNNQTSVPEPSALYAVGTALALLGGAGWILRRK